MLIKLGTLWVSADRIDAIIPPEIVANDPHLITHNFFAVTAHVRDIGMLECGRADTYNAALIICDEYANLVNNSQQSYSDDYSGHPQKTQ